jgi:hypothetical protein
MFDEDGCDNMPMHNFQQMIGFIGDSFLGERIFYVAKQSPKSFTSSSSKNSRMHNRKFMTELNLHNLDASEHNLIDVDKTDES